MMWTEKYRPKTLDEFVNQKEALKIFINWMKRPKKGKALLFYGQPGTGKTSLVEAYAAQNSINLIEMNASDYRSAKQIREVIGSSISQQTLFKKSKIFLIDEVDGLTSRKDFGGVKEIIEIIKQSIYPIVLTANDAYDSKLRNLRNHCQLVKFGKVSVWDIEAHLEKICKKEEIECDKNVLLRLAKLCHGDLRSAVNDLENISQGKKQISLSDLENIGYSERDKDIFTALSLIFKSSSMLSAKLSITNVDKDPDEIFWWIENNIINEYEAPVEIANAYSYLSKADVLRKRISSRQYWKLLAYMIDLMTGGVAMSKNKVYKKFTKYQYPSNIMILGSTKYRRAEANAAYKKLSLLLHCSTRTLKRDFLPYIRILMKNPNFRKELATTLPKEEILLLRE